MRYFNPTDREFVEPVPLNILQQQAQYLTQRHDKAIELYSQLDQALANMDMNEDEAEWVAGKRNEIADILENGTVDNLSAFAVNDLIKGRNKILFGPDTLGRLKRQQAWKANNDKIDKMKLSEDYKRIFKELNPYGKYQDRYDKNGNLIEGEAWKPTVNPVNTVPLNLIFDNALKWAAKQTGGGTKTRWLDINGNVTDDPSQSATGEIFSQTTGKWEKVSPEKLREAIEASIDSTPGARESLRQDYDISKWKYNNGEESDVIGKDGVIMTPTEYLNSKVTPFINAAQYFNQTSATQYGDALKTQMQLARKGAYGVATSAGGDTDNGRNITDILQGKSDMITIPNNMPTEAKGAINVGKQTLATIFKKYGINKDVEKLSSDEIKNIIISNKNITGVEAFQALQALDDIQFNTEYLNSVRNALGDEDSKLQFDAYNTIISGSNDNSNNKYVKQYNDYVNYWYNGNKAIGQGFSDNDTYNEFLAQLGGEDAAKKLGIRLTTRNGKHVAELPKEFSKNLHLFTSAANVAYNNTHNWFGDKWNQTINFINAECGDNSYVIDNDNNIQYETGRRIGDVFNIITPKGVIQNAATSNSFGDFFNDLGKISSTTARNAYQGLNNFMNNLQKSYDGIIGNSGNLTLSNNVITEATPNLAEISFMMQANPTEASKLNAVYKLNKEQAENAVRSFSPIQHGLYRVGDNGTFEKVSSGDRLEYSNRLKNVNPDNLVMAAMQDPSTGNWGIQVIIPGKTNEKGEITSEPITVFMPDVDSKIYESWNNDSTFKAKNEINKYHAAGRNIPIVTNIFHLPDNFTLVPNGDGFVIKQNQTPIGNINKAEAIEYRDIFHQYTNLKNAISAGINIKPEAAQAILDNTALSICKLYGITDQDGFDEILKSISQM